MFHKRNATYRERVVLKRQKSRFQGHRVLQPTSLSLRFVFVGLELYLEDIGVINVNITAL